MVSGLTIKITATYGYRTNKALDLIIIMAIGFIPTMDGHGYRATIGAGHLSIMDVGPMTMPTDGCGYQVINGHRHGFRGEAVEIIMDGRHSDQI